MLIVGCAAAMLSFDTWVRLAQSVGFTATLNAGPVRVHIAWLLPLAVDVYAYTATRIWLTTPNRTAARYAARNAVGAIALSVAGNALFHAYDSAGWVIRDSPVVVIAIGGIPPLLLGLVVHLHTLINRTEPQTQPEPVPVTEPTPIRPPPHLELVAEPGPVQVPNRIDPDAMAESIRPFVDRFTIRHGRPPGRQAARTELSRHGYRVGLLKAEQVVALASEPNRIEQGVS